MPAPFKRLSVAEFALLLERFPFSRRITSVHLHHTWRPNHAQFRGHDSLVTMWRHHTQGCGLSDIAQHLIVDPDGHLWTGRNWNAAPASAAGFNGNTVSGPFMVAVVGDFDRGMDTFSNSQRAAVLDASRLVQTKFGLAPDALLFHSEIAHKRSPPISIDRPEFLEALRTHQPSIHAGARGDPALFGPSALASSEAVAQAITLLTELGDTRSTEPNDAEIGYGGEWRSLRESAAPRAPELGPEDIEELRPHVVNLRQGQFSSDGKMTTTSGDVEALFKEHLPRWASAHAQDGKLVRVVFFAHGGLVKESTGLAGASKACAWWLQNGVYPIFFIWETGLLETIGDLLMKIKRKAAPEGARDLFDWTTDPIVEEAARALQAPRIWNGMKASAAAASGTGGGARFVAKCLRDFQDAHGNGIELHAVGHSAGSIFHGHFLPMCRAEGISFQSLQLLAPAITCDDFQNYLQAMSANNGTPPFTTMFTMNRTFERADQCMGVYRKSLLYLVSEACERERKTPILGLEDYLRKDGAMQAFFGLGKPSTTGTVVWSKSPTHSGRSATQSTTHGGFDDDAPTMDSVLRRIKDLPDASSIIPFPASAGGRSVPRDWTAEVDWPEAFDRSGTGTVQVTVPVPGPVTAMSPSSTLGRRVAVCIGINAYPTAPLDGCVADAEKWRATLAGFGFEVKRIPEQEATRQRILSELGALIAGSQAGDTLVFQYSGHGTQVEDIDGDEADGDTPGLDEALCPIDFGEGHFLIDDDIADLVRQLPADAHLSFILDCCHSGTGTRFAARAFSIAPAGTVVKARYIRPSAEQRERHRQFRRTAPAPIQRNLTERARAITTMREVTFAACKSSEVAWEVDGQGEFTRRAHQVLASAPDGLTNAGFIEAVLRAFGPNARQQPQLDCDVPLRSMRWLGL